MAIFLNSDAIIRLLGAVLMEQNEECLLYRRSMTLKTLEQTKKTSPELLVAA